MSTRITLANLTKRFAGGAGTAAAVDNVSLSIEPGELFFLLGPSGCGKTTLLRMIAGFIDPTGGSISFTTADGRTREVTHLPPNKRNTGMVFQSYALWPHMTVEANVAFGLSVRRVAGQERTRRVGEALDVVRMGEYATRKPNQLSGGQQQRVALARALVIRPDVLLLDEPLSNLDAKLRIELRSEIRRICKESRAGSASQAGMTTVYVTHDQKEALSMADRVAIMRAGKIVQIGTPEELYRAPRTKFVAEFLGETNFVGGTVHGIEDGQAGGGTTGAPARLLTIQTAAGVIRAASSAGVAVGQPVTCSIRPEAIRVHSGEPGAPEAARGTTRQNEYATTVVDSTYLGEMVQYTLQTRDVGAPAGGSSGVRFKAAVFNPGVRSGEAGRERVMRIDPADVVVLAE